MECCKTGINRDGDKSQTEDVESDAHSAANSQVGILLREECKSRTVLVECHPEEDNHGKDEQQCHDAVFGLLGGQLLYGYSLLLGLLGSDIGMLEPSAEGEIDDC